MGHKNNVLPRVLPQDWFEMIFRLLHLSDEEDGTPARRIDKVKPLLDRLIIRFQTNYMPSRCVAVDKMMVGFCGRFGPKQYLPKKACQVWDQGAHVGRQRAGLCTQCTSVHREWNPLSGQYRTQWPSPASTGCPTHDGTLPPQGTSRVHRPLLHQSLANTLYANNTAFTGTAIWRRIGLQEAVRHSSPLCDDQVRAYRDDNLLAVEWRAAKKSLLMLSTKDTAQSVQVTSRTTGREISKPTLVHHYNLCMNGVDLADQCTVYYSFIKNVGSDCASNISG